MFLVHFAALAVTAAPVVAGNARPACVDKYYEVLELSSVDRVRATDAMDLDALISLTECGYAHGHPTLHFLGTDLGRRGAVAVPAILNRLSTAKNAEVIFGFLAVLRDISQSGQYDFSSDDNARRITTLAVSRMPEPRDSAVRLLEQMHIDCTKEKGAAKRPSDTPAEARP